MLQLADNKLGMISDFDLSHGFWKRDIEKTVV